MEEDTRQKLQEMEQKLDKVYQSTEKTRKYFLWTFIISIVVFVAPLVIVGFVISFFFSAYGDISNGRDINQTLDQLGL